MVRLFTVFGFLVLGYTSVAKAKDPVTRTYYHLQAKVVGAASDKIGTLQNTHFANPVALVKKPEEWSWFDEDDSRQMFADPSWLESFSMELRLPVQLPLAIQLIEWGPELAWHKDDFNVTGGKLTHDNPIWSSWLDTKVSEPAMLYWLAKDSELPVGDEKSKCHVVDLMVMESHEETHEEW
ncbi:hypothetical protein M7I_3305 [Glarea lozoyensis 74030]|uniref:Uncharacterized protein n=1 Tax=Glarea lozoyensis (strain ATCC 74030 / MF5533) TaxID=1104152 RepID=H0EKQ0_GLAL7|nr:hypothetical protein M7I_3305 [Glarea lozoyensis 74030]